MNGSKSKYRLSGWQNHRPAILGGKRRAKRFPGVLNRRLMRDLAPPDWFLAKEMPEGIGCGLRSDGSAIFKKRPLLADVQ